MKKLAFYAQAFILSVGFLSLMAAAPSQAIDLFSTCDGSRDKDTSICQASTNDDAKTLVTNITGTLLFFIGAVAVIMIVIGGIKYVTANGNAENIKSAKNTIMYSLLGLIAAIAAQALVVFVVNAFK